MANKVMRLAAKFEKLTIIPPPDRAADGTAKFLSKWPTRCLDHEEVVTHYCLDHDTLTCDVCGLASHKHCGTVMTLLDAAKGIRTSREVTQIDTALKKLVGKYEKMHKEQADVLSNLQEQEKEFVRAVKDFRSEINAILDRLENAVLARKDNYATKRRDMVKEHKQSCKTAMTLLENYNKDLDRNFLGNDEQSLFVAMKKTKVVVSKYEEQYRMLAQAPKKVTLTFIPNNTIAKFFMTLRDFGEMKADQSMNDRLPVIDNDNTSKGMERRQSRGSLGGVSSATPSITRRMSVPSLHTTERINLTSSFESRSERGASNIHFPSIGTSVQQLDNTSMPKTRRPVHIGEVSVYLDSDSETPFVTGLSFLADDRIVVADDANKSVKIFTPAFKPIAMAKLSAPPRDVAPIKPQELVVTIPNEKALQFIETGKELLLRKKINLDIECSGITCYQHELYVTSGFSNDREIQVVSLNGDVRKRIRPGIADLRYPLYIEVDPRFRTIFVTDFNHGVVGMDVNGGEVKFKCKDTDVHSYYKGIAVGNKGNIYVCTWNLHGVSRVHLDGRGLETVIPMPGKEGRKPHSVAFSKKSERLIVSLCGGKRACVSVYRYQ